MALFSTTNSKQVIFILLTLNSSYLKTCKTPLGESGCLGSPYYFTGYLSIQFFNSPLPLTQSVRPPIVTYPSLCSTCVTYGTPCHAICHQVLPTHLGDLPGILTGPLPRQRSLAYIPREAEDFPRGDKHFKYVPPPTYLIYLSPKDLYR